LPHLFRLPNKAWASANILVAFLSRFGNVIAGSKLRENRAAHMGLQGEVIPWQGLFSSKHVT
jgi:hypothetical protein